MVIRWHHALLCQVSVCDSLSLYLSLCLAFSLNHSVSLSFACISFCISFSLWLSLSLPRALFLCLSLSCSLQKQPWHCHKGGGGGITHGYGNHNAFFIDSQICQIKKKLTRNKHLTLDPLDSVTGLLVSWVIVSICTHINTKTRHQGREVGRLQKGRHISS